MVAKAALPDANGLPRAAGGSAAVRVANFYHILLYLWDRHGEELSRSSDERVGRSGDMGAESLPDLFAILLSEAMSRQLRRGLHREYREVVEVAPRIRGRLDLAASVGRQLLRQGLAECAHDEFSPDTPHNRIIKATLLTLLRGGELSKEVAATVRGLMPRLGGIPETPLLRRHFAEARLRRDNREYGLMLDICRFVFEASVPDSRAGDQRRFLALTERWVAQKGDVFQEFVQKFYQVRAGELCTVRRTDKTFDHPLRAAKSLSKDEAYLQGLLTDVLLDMSDGRTLVIECKFYGNPFGSKADAFRERDAAQQAVKSTPKGRKLSNEHILQLGAYMDGITRGESARRVEGLLLYVQPDESPINADFIRQGVGGVDQLLRVRCLDLSQPWEKVEADLLSYLAGRD